MKRVTFVGQAPSRETDGKPPFVGRCGKFLADLLGTTQEQMLRDHEFLNILNYWPGKGPGGDKFPMAEARMAAQAMLPALSGKTVILLGANVARAFNAPTFEYYRWYQIRSNEDPNIVVPSMTVMPHVSGVVRTWNKPENRAIAREFLRQVVHGTKK